MAIFANEAVGLTFLNTKIANHPRFDINSIRSKFFNHIDKKKC